jgi:hypothetical protein
MLFSPGGASMANGWVRLIKLPTCPSAIPRHPKIRPSTHIYLRHRIERELKAGVSPITGRVTQCGPLGKAVRRHRAPLR